MNHGSRFKARPIAHDLNYSNRFPSLESKARITNQYIQFWNRGSGFRIRCRGIHHCEWIYGCFSQRSLRPDIPSCCELTQICGSMFLRTLRYVFMAKIFGDVTRFPHKDFWISAAIYTATLSNLYINSACVREPRFDCQSCVRDLLLFVFSFRIFPYTIHFYRKHWCPIQ